MRPAAEVANEIAASPITRAVWPAVIAAIITTDRRAAKAEALREAARHFADFADEGYAVRWLEAAAAELEA